MSDFHELIKNFQKSREYVRDFFVYGFKTRNDFKGKSARTYDNERRRLESWLSPYVRKDYAQNGANISLAMDSNLLDDNPLFQVWKTKSFTDNDIMLHFFILDLLQNNQALTAEQITDYLLTQYETLFDIQIVRRKCNDYVKEGLLQKRKSGKNIVYSLDCALAHWIKSNDALLDALAFFQMAGHFGVIGNEITEQFDFYNRTFRVKHSFFVHTLEDEMLFQLLTAMKHKQFVMLELNSSKRNCLNTTQCVPLQIFVSARSGRRFLCGYLSKSKRFTCFRLDSIKKILPLEKVDEYDDLLHKLARNHQHLWGVSFQGEKGRHLEQISMTLQINESDEHYIIERLAREGRGGSIRKIAANIYRYENQVFDCNEMLPWIRTFIGRIISLKCTAQAVEKRFYQDLQTMYHMYCLTEDHKSND